MDKKAAASIQITGGNAPVAPGGSVQPSAFVTIPLRELLLQLACYTPFPFILEKRTSGDCYLSISPSGVLHMSCKLQHDQAGALTQITGGTAVHVEVSGDLVAELAKLHEWSHNYKKISVSILSMRKLMFWTT